MKQTPLIPCDADTALARLAKYDLHQFENMVLSGIMRLEAVWNRMRRSLCISPVTKEWVNEFEDLENYYVYRAFFAYREFMDSRGMDFEKVDVGDVMLGASLLQSRGDTTITGGTMPILEERLNLLLGPGSWDDRTVQAVADAPMLTQWLICKHIKMGLQTTSMMGVSPEALLALDALVEARDDAAAVENDDVFVEVNQEEDDEVVVERIPSRDSTLTNLEACLGGGFGKKEHVIFAAPSGQGKTTLACQIAGSLAKAGYQVLYISTEQPGAELKPRFLSSMSYHGNKDGRIPFSEVKDGGYMSKWTAKTSSEQFDIQNKAKLEARSRILQSLEGKLHFVNWLGSGHSVSELGALVKEANRRYKVNVDCVILDWIGGALDGSTTDPSIKRQLYISAAKAMKDLAYKYNVAAISFAQTTADAVDKQKVSERHLGECKAIHHEAVAAIGISAMHARNNNPDEADGESAYAKEQWFYVFKSRKAQGVLFKMIRNFSYQRFDNPNTAPK